MRLLVTATGPTLDAEVAHRLRLCQCFLLIDTERMEFTPHDNAGAPGTESWAVSVIASTGARAVLTGSCGPRAHQVLSAVGMHVVTGISGTVEDVVHRYLAGREKGSARPRT